MSALAISNRQRVCGIDTAFLKNVVRHLLDQQLALKNYGLGIFLVGDKRMIEVNEAFLHHAGVTDVITFDYGDSGQPQVLHGEIFVCLPEAQRQAQLYGVKPAEEIIRYIVHGILHLQGHDDHAPAKRRVMKQAENRLVRALSKRFELINITPSKAAVPSYIGKRRA